MFLTPRPTADTSNVLNRRRPIAFVAGKASVVNPAGRRAGAQQWQSRNGRRCANEIAALAEHVALVRRNGIAGVVGHTRYGRRSGTTTAFASDRRQRVIDHGDTGRARQTFLQHTNLSAGARHRQLSHASLPSA